MEEYGVVCSQNSKTLNFCEEGSMLKVPGSMFLMAYLDRTPILGLSGCVLHDPVTAFDLLLPRLLAGEKVSRSDIIAMGHGGLQRRHDH